jgi:FkbM family methyltransferase
MRIARGFSKLSFSNLSRKIRLVAVSDLVPADKFRYLRDGAMAFLGPLARNGSREYRLRGGACVILRESSTDQKVFEEVFLQKTYAAYTQAAQQIAPTILIDLGANIGLSVIALARELQPQVIVAVEPDRENFTMLQENLRRAGWTDRCVAVQAFAGAERGFAELVDSGNGAWGMRMGAPARSGIPVLPVEEIVILADDLLLNDRLVGTGNRPEAKVLLKCDIEGGELHLFRHLRQWEDRVHYVILELHTEFLSVENFHAYLEDSRYHWHMDGKIPPDALLAVIGLERLQAKVIVHGQRAAGS